MMNKTTGTDNYRSIVQEQNRDVGGTAGYEGVASGYGGGFGGRSRGVSQEGNPYYENRSPSPRIKASTQDNKPRDFGIYNPLIDKKEYKPNPLVEPDSGLSSLLDEVEDDFRLTIFKMKPDGQRNLTNNNYNVRNPQFSAFRMMGRGTVGNDYAAQALDRVLRPLGLPDTEDMVNRFQRY